jgi:hypothetical protein
LRHFRKNNFEVENEEAADQANVEEKPVMEQDESYRVEKILACKKPSVSRKKSLNQVADEIIGLSSKIKTPYNNYKFLIKWEDLEYRYTTWEDQYIILKFKDVVKKYFESRKKKPKIKKPASEMKIVKLVSQPDYIEGTLYDY